MPERAPRAAAGGFGAGTRVVRPVPGAAARASAGLVVVVSWFLALTSCAATPVPGEPPQSSWWPGWQDLGAAAVQAARSPATWGPLLGAGLLQIGDADEELSDWAADETPLFGSNEAADTASDVLRWTAAGGYGMSVLTGSDARDRDERPGRVRTLAVGAASAAVNVGITQGLKRATGRERPDASDHRSFPSQHASDSALFATLGIREIEALMPASRRREVLRWGFGGMAAAAAWARVEARKHFPSDALAGAALGHFVGALFHSAFLEGREHWSVMPQITLSRREWRVGFRGVF